MYSKVLVLGNLGTEPELRFTPEGQAVCSFSVASNRKWTGRDGQPQEQVTWYRVSVWGAQAEACNQYLSKGRQVFIEATLTPDRETGGPRIWTDNEGRPRASFELRALSVQFLSGGQRDGQIAPGRSEPEPETVDEGEFPF